MFLTKSVYLSRFLSRKEFNVQTKQILEQKGIQCTNEVIWEGLSVKDILISESPMQFWHILFYERGKLPRKTRCVSNVFVASYQLLISIVPIWQRRRKCQKNCKTMLSCQRRFCGHCSIFIPQDFLWGWWRCSFAVRETEDDLVLSFSS